MAPYVALLRGINVGGHKRVPMAELRELFVSLGLADVRTLLQSGNVVFSAQETSTSSLEERLERATLERFGFEVAYVVRSRERFLAALASNPLADRAAREPGRTLIMFLKRPEDAGAAKAFADADGGPETVRAVGEQLYIYYPDGQANSNLNIGLVGTARNWNTATKIALALEAL